MANLNLVTGYAGQEHVTASDAGALYAALFGKGQYVLASGNQLSASAVSSSQIRVLDGDILMQGRHIRIEPDTKVDLAIVNGASGYFRNDLIVARYTKDASTGKEEANLIVIKGEANTVAASDPAYTSGDILSGNAMLNDMPLYRIRIEGLNVKQVEPLFETVGQLGAHATDKNNPHNVTAAQIGASASSHNHTLDGLSGTLSINKGGTEATTAEGARAKLGITPANIGAAASGHNHALEGLNNIHVVSSAPSTFTDGHWYLVKES